MKNSRIFKGGTILLVIALAVGVFALVVWADGNGTGGKFSGNMGNATNRIDRRAEAPDDDGVMVSPTGKMRIMNLFVMKNVNVMEPVEANLKAVA